MKHLALHHPTYGWQTNVGYGTLKHRQAIALSELTREHRVSFCKEWKGDQYIS